MKFITNVCDIECEVEANNSLEALEKKYPKFKWQKSDIPSGIREKGSFDGTQEEPFLVQVKKPNGVWDWFVNLGHPKSQYWKK